MIDLHTHTTASDGIYTPSELISMADSAGITLIAVTDHDSFEGIIEAEDAARGKGIEVIPGCEFSIDYEGGDFHLLAYNIEFKGKKFPILDDIKRMRVGRINRMIDDIRKSGADISISDVMCLNALSSPGKPHVARALVKKGYAADMKDAFEKYMCEGRPGFVPKKKINIEDAFRITNECGGFSVLAHPATLNMDDESFEKHLANLKDMGLSGVEVYSGISTDKQSELYMRLASKYDLLVTGGSDFHGDHNETLGFYKHGHCIPESIAGRFYEFCKN